MVAPSGDRAQQRLGGSRHHAQPVGGRNRPSGLEDRHPGTRRSKIAQVLLQRRGCRFGGRSPLGVPGLC
eukprot:1016942-Lingulodinium_polyedra.AAC.1